MLPPGDSRCPGFATTLDTSDAGHCLLAVNAGFFDVKTGDCIGNVVSKGQLVQLSGLENVNFGITKKGEYVIGYLTREDVEANTLEFSELVSGMLWLVRERVPYYCQSYDIEQPYSYFIDQSAPRTIIGHDEAGRLYVVVVEGNPITRRGLTIPETTDLALSYNLVNVVNLDGGSFFLLPLLLHVL